MLNMSLETLEDVLEQVREIYRCDGRDLSSILHKQIILNGIKCKRDELSILDLKILNRAMAEIRYAARVFKPYRDTRKVSVFGSARISEKDPCYEMAYRFSRMLAEQNFMVITGAAEGIMKAGNAGAGAEKSFGVNILLPGEQTPNEIVLDDPKLITFKYFFTRKLFFLMEAHAVALFPGGFGTHDEGFETLTLLQTGKTPPIPLLLMEPLGEDYWEVWDHFIRDQLLKRNFISQSDLSLYRIIHSPDEGVEWIKFFYSTYHSMRLAQGKVVLRLERELTDDHIRQLNKSFSDITEDGKIEKSSAFEEEANEPNLLSKPRIILPRSEVPAGRLIEIILMINRMGQSVQSTVGKRA